MLASEIHDPAAAAFANTATVVCDQTLPADYPTNVRSLATLNTGSGHFDNANPFQTVQAFKQKALSLGIRFVENNLFVSLEKQGGFWRIKSARCNIEAPVLVNCAGAWGDQIAAMLRDPVPIGGPGPDADNHGSSETLRQAGAQCVGPLALVQTVLQRHRAHWRRVPGLGRTRVQPHSPGPKGSRRQCS